METLAIRVAMECSLLAAPNGSEAHPLGPLVDIYARLSFAPGGETINVEDQIAMGTDDIVARGGRVGSVFTDNSKSAWNRKVIRQNWVTMMERLENGQSDGVWVYNLDRFTRKVMEGERLVEAAHKGLHVWSRHGEYDLRTADGRDAFRSAVQAAARESDRNSERTQDGKTRAARAGLSNGGVRTWAMPGLVPLGPDAKKDAAKVPAYKAKRQKRDDREWESDERVAAEREIARDCIERIIAGETVYSVVVDLNERGASGERAALPVQGGRWSHRALTGSLLRPAMAALLVRHGKVVGKLADIEPVVEQEKWELLVAIFAARKTGRPVDPQHILTRSMRCGRCGRFFIPQKRSDRQLNSDGSAHVDYRCPTPNSAYGSPKGEVDSCGRNSIDARVAEDAVNDAMITRLRDSERAELVAEEMAQARTHRASIIDEIERAEAEADKLSDKTGSWGVERVDNAMQPFLKKIADLRSQLDLLGDRDLIGAAVDDAVAKWERVCADGDVDAQRRMIRRTFPNLTVAPQEYRGDQRVSRILWDGPIPAPTPNR